MRVDLDLTVFQTHTCVGSLYKLVFKPKLAGSAQSAAELLK